VFSPIAFGLSLCHGDRAAESVLAKNLQVDMS